MKKVLAFILAAVMILSMAACGGSGSSSSGSGSSSSNSGSSSKSGKSSKANTTYTWGAVNGLYGDVTVEYNDNGTVASKTLVNAANDKTWVRLDFEYGNPDDTYLNTIYTRTVNNYLLYNMCYYYRENSDGSYYVNLCQGTEYLENVLGENSTYYQPSGNSTWTGYGYSQYYWITELEDGDPVITRFYSRDGLEEETMALTWTSKNGKITGASDSYGTYTAEYSDDGLTLDLYADLSSGSDNKRYTEYILTYAENGCLTNASCERYNEENTGDDHVITVEFERDDDGKPVSSTYTDTDYNNHEITYSCDADGNLECQNNLVTSLGSGDIGARSYTYYDDGGLKTISYYHDFEVNPEKLDYTYTISEDGLIVGLDDYYSDGTMASQEQYDENGNVTYRASYAISDEGGSYMCNDYYYDENGNEIESTSYYPDGEMMYHETRNEHGCRTLFETSERKIQEEIEEGDRYCIGTMEGNVYTEIQYGADGSILRKEVYTYGEDSYTKVEYYDDDGTLVEGSSHEWTYD